MLGVPLSSRGASLGVLHVGSLTPRRFTRDEVELLQLVAERVAIAIERARLHEETVQLDQFKLNFVAIASHELRTPATSVYGVLKTLAERGPELTEDLREELLRVGVEQGERLRRLLEELLDLSRLDAKAIDVDPRPRRPPRRARRHRRRRATGRGRRRARRPGRSRRGRRSARARACRHEPRSSTRRATAQPPIRIVGASSATGTSAVAVEDSGPGIARSSRGGSSTASRAARRRDTGSASRSRARTRRRTAATSSTTRGRRRTLRAPHPSGAERAEQPV